MPRREDRRSYIVFRPDGLVIHTKPVTRDEAEWLYRYAYKDVEDRAARIRYLEEWGNVMDVSPLVERLDKFSCCADLGVYNGIAGFFESPKKFQARVDKAFKWVPILGLLKEMPEARQILDEFLGRLEDFLREPVKPKPITAPVRYLEVPNEHVAFSGDGAVEEAELRPEWRAYKNDFIFIHGISVFRESFWLWERAFTPARVVVVRRDVDDRELVAAVANDNMVQGFLGQHGNNFRELLREHEAELVDKGYEDVVRKAKAVLTTADLLNAGRREEALPA